MEIGEPVSICNSPTSEQPEYTLVQIVEVVKVGSADKDQPAVGRRQYVNLDENTDPSNSHPEYGRFIRLKARVMCTNGSSPAGQSVYWSYVAGNNRNGLSTTEKEGFNSAGGPATTTATTDDTGWTPPVKFYLSQYGGDTFDIAASLTASSGSKSELKVIGYETWRRIFYDITEMKTSDGNGKYDLPIALENKIKTAFSDVFIDLYDTGKRNVGEYQDDFDEVEKGFKWADKHCTSDGVPLKLHICIIDRAIPFTGPYGAKQKQVEVEANSDKFTSPDKIQPYDFAGHNWLVKKEYFDGTAWHSLYADVTLNGARGARKFLVDFSNPPIPLAPLQPSTANKIKIRITYMEAGCYGGWGGSNSLHLLICRGIYEDILTRAQANQQITVACIHEPGHAMGLVGASNAWHDAVHQAHCIYNDCAMWWQSSPGNERFHPETKSDPGCRTLIRQKNLEKSAMSTAWKFPR
jgi:hypothetical protein